MREPAFLWGIDSDFLRETQLSGFAATDGPFVPYVEIQRSITMSLYAFGQVVEAPGVPI